MRAVYEGRVERTAVHKGRARETAVSSSCSTTLYMYLLLYLNRSVKIPGFGMHPFASGNGSILGLCLQLWLRIRS